MNKRAGWGLLFGTVALFLVLNRTAYKGYFQDDDLDTNARQQDANCIRSCLALSGVSKVQPFVPGGRSRTSDQEKILALLWSITCLPR